LLKNIDFPLFAVACNTDIEFFLILFQNFGSKQQQNHILVLKIRSEEKANLLNKEL
jgi:hypothetical protein